MFPKFSIQEDWNGPDVTIFFKEEMSSSLHNYISKKLEEVVPTLNEEDRTTYNLEKIVNGIFSDIALHGRLAIIGVTTKRWTIKR